jgi:D-3-phosphoglycerate dehydrogenase
VANAARALGMDVLGYDPFLSQYAKDTLDKSVRYDATPEEIFASCDFVTVHVPFMPATKGMVNAELLGKAKKGIKILNFARGELVNNADIKAALESGQCGRYITDFPTEELLGVKGIIPVPHLGASTEESEENCAEMAAKQLKNFLETGNIKNSVNFPNIEAKVTGTGARICFVTKEDPGFEPKLQAAVKETSESVVCVTNTVTKGGYTYYIVDLDIDKAKASALVGKVSALGGMRVRVL